jgi:Protein of Unknown function (DUF2784)
VIYRLLADAVVLVHLGFVLFVVAGGLLVWRFRRFAWIHLPAAAWGAAIEFGGWVCPLTPLENWLRMRGGGTVFDEGFVEHYILPVLYPVGLTRTIQVVLGLLVVIVNVGLYVGMLISYRQVRMSNTNID